MVLPAMLTEMSFRSARLAPWMILAALLASPASRVVADEGRTGEQIYRQMCASCHGADGEGTPEEYPKALAGDKSVPQLARLIAKTMPADDPGTCTGEDAEKVSSYIHEAFYSREAQARNAPPRIELSRLTVRQYRHAVADLIGAFRDPASVGEARGLRGEYFKSYRTNRRDRVIERVDPEVHFDFGEASPDPEKVEAERFSIRWSGSLLAPETGEYEFIVRTEHAARLWVNDPRTPLIDAGVKSGDDTEYRGTVFLLGGRSYPLRLQFSKGRQGDPDGKKKKEKDPPARATISLEWKLPGRVAAVIPRHGLSPDSSPEGYCVATPFPPDDRSVGYERGTAISKAWDQATTDAAIETAAYILAHLREFTGPVDDAPDRGPRLLMFARRFAERAFRRPLPDELRRLYVDRQFAEVPDPEAALKRVVLLVLKSPRFLYRELGGDGYDVASRLAFGLWDSLPDRDLLDAAAAGRLATRDQVRGQAERMAADPRARAKVREFLLQWLRVDRVTDVAKDPKLYPEFDEPAIADLRTSLDLFLDEVLDGRPADFRQLLLADAVHLNGRLAKLYGADLPADAPFQKVSLDQGERAGVLTHPYLMASFAYTATSSPIHRGVFLSRSVLGRTLRPPPEAVAPLAPDLHPDLTTRERVALQTRPQACNTCHAMINPLGFTLERYDAIGRYRTEEKGRPVDSTGAYLTRSGESVTFDGARDLAAFLASSEETHTAFVEQLFHYLIKQPIRAFGPRTSADLRRSFAEHGFDIRNLMVEIATTAARTARDAKP